MTRRTIRKSKRKTRTIRKSIRKTRTIRKSIRKTRTLRGGYDKIQVQNFRKMFMNSLIGLQQAINKNVLREINRAKDNFKSNLISNQNNINILIPVDKDGDPVNKYSEPSGLERLVPPLVVIFNKIHDMNIRSTLLNSFIANGADINLTNYVKDITVLSEAIRLEDKPLIKLLQEKDVDTNILSKEQRNDMNELLKEPVIEEPVIEATVVAEPVIEKPVIEETSPAPPLPPTPPTPVPPTEPAPPPPPELVSVPAGAPAPPLFP